MDRRDIMVMANFYGTARAGAQRLSGGGGPFGFDVTKALLVDVLIDAYRPDALIEAGCHTGDTTSYLARMYPVTEIRACDLDATYASIAKRRTRDYPNVTVSAEDSRHLVSRAVQEFERPLFYLDAHWGSDWPLIEELRSISSGVALIDDFDLGHPRFAFDSYNGVACDLSLIAAANQDMSKIVSVPNIDFDWPLPCLQIGRRSGWAVAIFEEPINRRLRCAGYLVKLEDASWRS